MVCAGAQQMDYVIGVGAGSPAAAGPEVLERQPGQVAAGMGRGHAAVPVLHVQPQPGCELRAVGRRWSAVLSVERHHHQRLGLPGDMLGIMRALQHPCSQHVLVVPLDVDESGLDWRQYGLVKFPKLFESAALCIK